MVGAERLDSLSEMTRGQLDADSEAWLLSVAAGSLDPVEGGCSVGEPLGLDGGVGSGDSVVTRGDGELEGVDSLGELLGLTVGLGLGVLGVGVGVGVGVGLTVVGDGVGVVGLTDGVAVDGNPDGM